MRFAHSSAYPSLPNGAKCNKHSDEDKSVRDIKHRPDSKVDKVHDSSSSQYIQEIAGGATDGSAEPELSRISLKGWSAQDQKNRPDDDDGPEQDKRTPTAYEAEAESRYCGQVESAVLTSGRARLAFDSGESELLARLVKNEGQPSSEEQHDQNHRDAELVFEVFKASTRLIIYVGWQSETV